MALIFGDRVKETTTTTGTGSYTLSGAVTGFQGIANVVGAEDLAYFCIENGTDWEIILGTHSEGEITRDEIIDSSNSGSPVNWGSGSKNIFLIVPALEIQKMSDSSSGKLKEIIVSSTGELPVEDCSGTILTNYGQTAENTQTLPTAEAGLNFTAVIGSAGQGAFHIKPAEDDKIYLNGTALDIEDKVSLSTPDYGDSIMFFTVKTGAIEWDWVAKAIAGTWTDGGGGQEPG